MAAVTNYNPAGAVLTDVDYPALIDKTLDQIIKTTCEYYNIRQADITGSSRARAVARPRQMVMFLSKTLTSRSYPEIARKLGGRDHTTVLYGVRKIEELMAVDSQIAEDAEILRRMLEA